MDLYPDPAPQFAACAALAASAGDDALADTLRALGAKISAAETLSFDDEAAAGEIADRLREPPFAGELPAALVAASLMFEANDPEMAGYALVALFRARKPTRDAGFARDEALLAAMVRATLSLDQHEDQLRWAFDALPAPARATWAARLAAASYDVGVENGGGWLELAARSVPDEASLRATVEDGFRALGLDAEDAARAMETLGRGA